MPTSLAPLGMRLRVAEKEGEAGAGHMTIW